MSSALLHRNLRAPPRRVTSSEGSFITLDDGQVILDATGGAAVSCLGHAHPRVLAAMRRQAEQVAYCHSLFFGTEAAEELARELCDGTGGAMTRAFIVSSGSEAMDATMKLARQYFLELAPAQPLRTRFIARRQSYHGATLGPLALGGHAARRAPYEPLLLPGSCSHVSPCYAYRGRVGGGEEEDGQVRETDEEYVARLARELDDEFRRVGPETVCAFVAEPIVGAALGCVPSLPGYFAAVRAVCERHGALLVFDEVMCGMGRSGTPHAWQSLLPAPVAPDIQTVGKVLGGGYVPIAAVLVGARVVDALGRGSGVFAHGQTYQGHPVACAVALEVQRVIREEGLLANVVKLARLLEEGLRERLEGHMHVGNIRGRGLFWGIEFVKDKDSKEPFDPQLGVAMGIHQKGLEPGYNISLYPGTGTADGIAGDHVLLAPAFNSTAELIDEIIDATARAVEDYFAEN